MSGQPGAAASSLGPTLRRGEARLRSLRALVRDTQRAISDVVDIIHTEPDVSTSVYDLGLKAARPFTLVLLGLDCSSKARLLNSLLGEPVLPTAPSCRWRWIRLQYGNTRQVRLNLSNSEFELMEELECHKRPWTVIPEKDLKRRDLTDLSTIMDIELNNAFLKDGLRILIPPDLDSKSSAGAHEFDQSTGELKKMHEEFYTKRMSILKQFTPICIYALNCTGKNVFSDHSCDITRRISKEHSRSDEEFLKTHNLYHMTRAPEKSGGDNVESGGEGARRETDYSEPCVFSEENCLDLQQLKELYPNIQMYFVLFSDSPPLQQQSTDSQHSKPIQKLNRAEISETNRNSNHQTAESLESFQNANNNEVINLSNSHNNTLSEYNRCPSGDRTDTKTGFGDDIDPITILGITTDVSPKMDYAENKNISSDGSNCLHADVNLKVTDFVVHNVEKTHKSSVNKSDKNYPVADKSLGERHDLDADLSVNVDDKSHQITDVTNLPTSHNTDRHGVAEEVNFILKLKSEATKVNEAVSNQSEELFQTHRVTEDNSNGVFELSGGVMQKDVTGTSNCEDVSLIFARQCSFMYDLADQWDHMCSPIAKTNAKTHWMILNELEVLKTTDKSSLAPFMVNAVRNVTDKPVSQEKPAPELVGDRLVSSRGVFLVLVKKYVTESVQNYLLEFCTRLSEIHVKLLQLFILASFDLAREIQVVPKKIEYVAVHEKQLYATISEKFSEGDKKEELVQIMRQVLQDMKTDINTMDWAVDDLPCHQDNRIMVSNSVFYGSRNVESTNLPTEVSTDLDADIQQPNAQPDIEQAISYDSYNFDDYDIITAEETRSLTSNQVESHLCERDVCQCDRSGCQDDNPSCVTRDSSHISLIRVENEESVNSSVFARIVDFKPSSGVKCTNSSQISIKQASLDVQKTVLTRLSRRISLRLVKFVDCLRDSYFGTLQRCLESLEASCREELGGRPATEAMRQVLSVARQVDLQTCASFSVLRTLVEHLRRIFQKLKVGGGGAGSGACCVLSPIWRRDIALHTLHTLSPIRLARLISVQILERLAVAHERYQAALGALQGTLKGRLHHTEDVKLSIRKRYAPGIARLCLESTSMCDVLQYGTPELGREIGRGQYGIVFACKGGWAGHEPCAVKSVLPSDERHYNELAMEFFYTRSIPAHPRIVRLWGSVVERHASGSPTVLLVTERKKRDLYCGVRTSNLSFSKRMRIALDIVEGIRYLHSLGLVHRDIKMKNVLLDADDRASLTDLGFCAPEALISGSIVGTPVHMAPELLTGDYDGCVDVYAFGILFWYLCAGNIKLPTAFEMFQNKEQLWSKVRRGLRPERLPHFTDECWELMESCWNSESSKRALLGDVQPILEDILERSLRETPAVTAQDRRESTSFEQDDSFNYSRLHVEGM